MFGTTPRRVSCGAMLALLVAVTLAFANDSSPRGTGTAPVSDEPRVLVLVGGTMVEGLIKETATGYFVELPRGRYLVPFERVLLSAPNRRAAYEKQRSAMRPPSPSAHVRLAQWCLRYGMNDEGKAELRAALELSANFEPARELLKNIEELERPAEPRHQRQETAAEKTHDGYDAPESASVAGLSRETARRFTARVQPLVVNSCGNTSCHGSKTKTDFRLQYVRHGRAGTRTLTQQNLAAVLRYVDLDAPRSSPLVIVPSKAHGGRRRPVFDGAAGRRQLELLRTWLEDVAADLADERPTHPALARRTLPEARNPFRPVGHTKAGTPPTTAPSGRREPDLLDRILDEERPDAFDPAEFNRKK